MARLILVRETCTISIDSVASRCCSPSGTLSKCPSSLVIYANICWLTGRLKATIVPECDVAEHHPANSGNKKENTWKNSATFKLRFSVNLLRANICSSINFPQFFGRLVIFSQFNTVYLCTAIRTHSALFRSLTLQSRLLCHCRLSQTTTWKTLCRFAWFLAQTSTVVTSKEDGKDISSRRCVILLFKLSNICSYEIKYCLTFLFHRATRIGFLC